MQCIYVNANVHCPDKATDGDLCHAHALALAEEGRGPLAPPKRQSPARSGEARWSALERAASAEKTAEKRAGCQGTTRLGRPCGFDVADGVGYCLNHFPGRDTSAAASHAARAPRKRPDPPQLLEAVLSFSDRESLQAVLDTIARLTLSGHITPERAGIVLRACSIAARNFNPIIETLEGPQPPSYDRLAYYHRVQSLLLSIDPLLDTPEPAE